MGGPISSGLDRAPRKGNDLRHEPDGEISDALLMRRFQGGDETAYDLLVRRHLAFVIRHARRYLADDSDAEDIAQEVFLRLYRSRHLFRHEANFPGWLATITSRLALNELRTRRRKHWVPRSTLEGIKPGTEWRPGNGHSPPPDGDLLQAERIAMVRQALTRLPERQRDALWLQRFEGWDLQEIGSALELSIPAVKSLLHRARASLLKELEPYMNQTRTLPQGEPR